MHIYIFFTAHTHIDVHTCMIHIKNSFKAMPRNPQKWILLCPYSGFRVLNPKPPKSSSKPHTDLKHVRTAVNEGDIELYTCHYNGLAQQKLNQVGNTLIKFFWVP